MIANSNLMGTLKSKDKLVYRRCCY